MRSLLLLSGVVNNASLPARVAGLQGSNVNPFGYHWDCGDGYHRGKLRLWDCGRITHNMKGGQTSAICGALGQCP